MQLSPGRFPGTCTLYKRLRVSNHFHTLFLICNENLTPTSYTSSEFLSANFRGNSAIFMKNCIKNRIKLLLSTFENQIGVFAARSLVFPWNRVAAPAGWCRSVCPVLPLFSLLFLPFPPFLFGSLFSRQTLRPKIAIEKHLKT